MSEEKQYSWSTNQENYHGAFASREEAIQDAMPEHSGTVWTGLNIYYEPHADADQFLEDLRGAAYDIGGEVSESWLDVVSKEDEEKLQTELQIVLDKWMKETNNEPGFWTVEEVERHCIGEPAETGDAKK